MRRWNGWGDASIHYPLPGSALPWLAERVGPSVQPRDATLQQVIGAVPDSPLPDHPLVRTGCQDRVRHARGQSLPDWVAMRTGCCGAFPAGVAYPQTEEDLRRLYALACQWGAVLIPYGGGTSVVGHINPDIDSPPALTLDLSLMSHLHALDGVSHLATFGAGVRGPHLEATLRAQGYTLGHFPQSFELSTLGGWIATRSSGQQSLYYGRVEDFFAGGRLVSPAGCIDMLPHAASAAGPDLRQWVLGSEGRLGILSRATVRISPLAQEEQFHAAFFHHWEQAVEAARRIVQERLPLSMLRLSNPTETETTFVLAGRERMVGLARRALDALGYRHGNMCLLLFGLTGDSARVRRARRDTLHVVGRHGGLHAGQVMGRQWRKSRFLTPYLRNSLWEAGYALDTLETVVPWSKVLPAAGDILRAVEGALEGTGERVHAFAHLSHLYQTGASIYVTFIFRVLPDHEELLDCWRRIKHAASDMVVACGGTISHQHGVGTDHAAYLEAEKGALGMALIRDAARHCDPSGLLNPGKLLPACQADPSSAIRQKERV